METGGNHCKEKNTGKNTREYLIGTGRMDFIHLLSCTVTVRRQDASKTDWKKRRKKERL